MMPVVVVEGYGVERRVDLLEGLPVPQPLHQMLPGGGPRVPVRARQHADSGGFRTDRLTLGDDPPDGLEQTSFF